MTTICEVPNTSVNGVMERAWELGAWPAWLRELSTAYASYFREAGLQVEMAAPCLVPPNDLEMVSAELDEMSGIVKGICEQRVFKDGNLLGTFRWQILYQETQYAHSMEICLMLARSWAPAPQSWPWAGPTAEVRLYPKRTTELTSSVALAAWLAEQVREWRAALPSTWAVGTKLAKRVAAYPVN